MVNIFNEVDEDIRKERYQSLWNKYGKYVISLIVLIIVIFSLSQYSKQKNITDNKKLLDIYYSAAEKIEINQYELANKSLEKVYNEKKARKNEPPESRGCPADVPLMSRGCPADVPQ